MRGFLTYVVNAIDEGIVAAVAHREPVAAEPDYVDIAIRVDVHPGHLEDVVRLQGQPADAEQDHDNHQHLDDLLLVPQQRLVAFVLGIAGRLGAPELHRHLDVDETDDAERDQELDHHQHVAIDSHVLLRKVDPVAKVKLHVEIVDASWKRKFAVNGGKFMGQISD